MKSRQSSAPVMTMQQLADSLELSRTAVSQVLNGHGDKMRIKKETQERVLAASREIGFCRNEAARFMVSGESRIVCMLVHRLSGDYNTLCAQGVLAETNQRDLFLKMATWTTTENFREILHHVLSLQPLGLICRDVSGDEIQILKTEMGLNPKHLVLTDDYPDCQEWAATVCSDDLSGMAQALEHLLQLGHRDIGYLAIPNKHCYRYAAFKQAAAEKKIAVLSQHCYFADPAVDDDFLDFFASGMPSAPSAVVCPSDGVAYDFMKGLEKRGIAVPRQISIIGYGDTHVAKFGVPHLTTIREDYETKGQEALRALLQLAKTDCDKKLPGRFSKKIPVMLISGETTEKNRKCKGRTNAS